jgi:hypothetical protein
MTDEQRADLVVASIVGRIFIGLTKTKKALGHKYMWSTLQYAHPEVCETEQEKKCFEFVRKVLLNESQIGRQMLERL